jgi:hypothetical protein
MSRIMLDWLRATFGEITLEEFALAMCLFLFVRLYTWAPQLGEALGGFFGGDGGGER